MDNVKHRWRHPARVLVALLAAAPLIAFSSNMATVTVKVTVVKPPPCTINDDRPIEVDFGEVIAARVDGSNYKMPVDYTLSCSEGSSNAIKLQVKGSGAGFDGSVLGTNKTGLGIELRKDDNKVSVNSWLNFTYPNKPALWAVPVKQSGATLSGGEFTAGATMSVAYQ